jgi:hypothetical protein
MAPPFVTQTRPRASSVTKGIRSRIDGAAFDAKRSGGNQQRSI